ncbi:Poly(A) binding protein 7, putative [Theobroma cacao]|uniref:Poly(A) binding protein 7, putative n=1 Tax=Theobroma cacao TaxID=3641 RepID=A0A061GVW4_THECC|nr:Poly(A) binding protein 7, putative [Theobroma cacao]
MDQLPIPLVSSMETANLYSLYVGDLDATVTEAQLTDFFSGINGFVFAVLCKDNNTGQSLRHGFVDFADLESARVAMATRNNTLMNGKAIRVMWRHDEYKTNEDANLFVKNLDSSIDNMKLQAIFAKYGNILSCKVQVFGNGNSKGYGYVQFETPESAKKAIEELNGHDIEGKKIYVDHFKKKEDRIQSDVGYTNLYVKNLKQSVTEETLQEKFSVFGNITSLVISRDSNGVSKGFGFVNFERPEDAKKAEESMNGAQLESKVLYVAKALKKQERQHMLQRQLQGMSQEEQIQQYKGFNVYVKHINDDVDEDQLKEFFNICGMVKSVKIMRNDNGISRGFGFVCFSKPEEAERAIRILNGKYAGAAY